MKIVGTAICVLISLPGFLVGLIITIQVFGYKTGRDLISFLFDTED